MDFAPATRAAVRRSRPESVRRTARAANRRRSRVLSLAAILCLVVSCGDDEAPGLAPPPPPRLVAATVTLEPSSVTLDALGDTVRLSATVLNQNGEAMTGMPIGYTSTDGSVVRVDGSGLVTAVGNGSAVVTAASGAATGIATVTVEQTVAQVRVSPDSITLVAIGDTVRLRAEALDSQGRAVPGTYVFEWSSNDSVAAVDEKGLVTAVRNGIATVTAAVGTVSGDATVNVEQVVAEVRILPGWVTLFSIGTTAQLGARALDANGTEVPDYRIPVVGRPRGGARERLGPGDRGARGDRGGDGHDRLGVRERGGDGEPARGRRQGPRDPGSGVRCDRRPLLEDQPQLAQRRAAGRVVRRRYRR